MTSWIISLISGAVGGNVAGGIFKKISLGTLWNSVAGILGGGLGGTILSQLGMAGGEGGGIGAILGQIGSGGVGGGIVLAVVSAIKNAMGKKA